MPQQHPQFTPQQTTALKRAAKAHARATGLSHSQALDVVAVQNGYANWSLLMKNGQAAGPAAPILSHDDWVEKLEDWFPTQHDRAVESSPWDGAEGGYQYPLIEDDAEIAAILEEAFPDAPEPAIAEAALNLIQEDDWLTPEFSRMRDDDSPGDEPDVPDQSPAGPGVAAGGRIPFSVDDPQ